MLRNQGSKLLKLIGSCRYRTGKGSSVSGLLQSEEVFPLAAKLAQHSWSPVRQYFTRPAQYQHFRSRQPWWQSTNTARVLVVVGGAGGVYYVTHIETVPYTHRRHAVLVSPSTERALGLETFKQFKEEAAAAGKLLPAQHPYSRLVSQIGLRIAAVAEKDADGQPTEHMKGLEWEFAVINEPTVNAFVVPGGKVVFYTGLLRLLETKDEIAAILGHEAAHVVARHTGEKLSSTLLFAALQLAAGLLLGIHLPSDIAQLVIFLPNSRKQETEADAIGLQLAAKACYDPAGALGAFKKLGAAEKKEGVSAPMMLRTHPLSTDRIKAIENNLPMAEQTYELAGCRAPQGYFSSSRF